MHIFFSGIGGVGIGPLAMICADAGHTIAGSDLATSRVTAALERGGVDVAIAAKKDTAIAAVHAKSPIDWLVVSAALPPDHPEIQFARAHGIKVTKRAEMLTYILAEKKLKLIAISGTHGKTTTTAMLVWLFKQFEKPVSYLVGTTLSFGPSGVYQPDSQFFVYECDEFDRNMLAFHPQLSIITTVDYDHADTYPTRADYDDAFRQFIAGSEVRVMWRADAERLGVSAQITIDETDAEVSHIKLAGQHNRENAWSAVKAFCHVFPEISPNEAMGKMASFPGTDRRFERLAPGVYTDYAHHPAEIRATLQLARELSPRVVAVYQPHQNSRQVQLIAEYKDCFHEAEHVYWLPTYLTREDPDLPTISPEQLIARLDDPAAAEPADLNEALMSRLREHLASGALVVFMGAGSIDAWAREHLSKLQK